MSRDTLQLLAVIVMVRVVRKSNKGSCMTQEAGKVAGLDKVPGCTDQMRSEKVKRRRVYCWMDSASRVVVQRSKEGYVNRE